jgi:hypothetical protein
MSKLIVKDLEGPSSSSNKIYIASGSQLDIAGSPDGASAINLAVDAADLTSGTIADARLPAIPNDKLADGHILQVKQTVFTGEFNSTTTGSWVAVTGMSVSITPSSTDSKILIMVQSSSGCSTSTSNVSHTIYRGGTTALYLGDAAGSRIRVGAGLANPGAWAQANFSLIYLDSPSTTSATTYQLYSQGQSATWRINCNGEDYDASNQWRAASSITVMELKA